MNYNRTFNISACHFNGLTPYNVVWSAVEPRGEHAPAMLAIETVFDLLTQIHGHNFKIGVNISADKPADSPWLIDDEHLTALVMEWDNTNVSMHPDFLNTKQRATTENMAVILANKVDDMLTGSGMSDFAVTVRVHETENIYAEVTVVKPTPADLQARLDEIAETRRLVR